LIKDTSGEITCRPIKSRIKTIRTENNDLLYACPGGLIAIGLMIDPSMTRNDRLVGNVLGYPGYLPDIYVELEISFYLLRRLIGVKSEGNKETKISKIVKGETLKLNVGSTETPGTVLNVKDVIKLI
jgi:translation initiation factor 2 subunit 3